MFSYRHVDYAHELWWQFVLEGDAPRFLRATAGVMIGIVVLGGLQLIRFAAPKGFVARADPQARDRAAAVLGSSTDAPASGALALLGDKQFLFSDSGRSFIMYGIQGRSWIAMGDAIGPADERLELLWRFREAATGGAAAPCSTRSGPLPCLTWSSSASPSTSLASRRSCRCPVSASTGPTRSGLRQALRRAERDGAEFSVVQPAEVPAMMPELRRVSDAWLESKSAKEKGFSLGRFDPDYLAHFPMALVRRGNELVAFANLWPTASRREISVDLMRFREGMVRDVMDYLFVQLLLWSKAQSYGRFDLGMAPLSGLQQRHLAPIWTRAGALLFSHGEKLYNFEGLRRYKDKFKPVWEPRYLAADGGLALPQALADVTFLVSGSALAAVRK